MYPWNGFNSNMANINQKSVGEVSRFLFKLPVSGIYAYTIKWLDSKATKKGPSVFGAPNNPCGD